ncbi:SPX-domain-containing protein [Acaromyces ingoldii]|uniref:SPX-domain-containing protein n=1 Tax=Acaromyces ingoldii TaxID=215250 RepID=A0A316YJP6_9BASI|nr:SPX-domain-containing protein [Acaromyces ingoldii]PWN89439.1 SPX-domain-containing protein [Acaromyces ingoldii]
MKFSHSLQFNSVPDWADRYIAYSNLKKAIYNLEQEQPPDVPPAASNVGDDIEQESAALLAHSSPSDADTTFVPLLDKELRKVVAFYGLKEADLFNDLDKLRADLDRTEAEEGAYDDDRDDDFSDEDAVGSDDGDEGAEPLSTPTTMRGTRQRRASLENLFQDPQRYNEASREERELRGWTTRPKAMRRQSRAGQQATATSAAGGDELVDTSTSVDADAPPHRPRRLSQALADDSPNGAPSTRPRRTSTQGPVRRLSSMFKRRSSYRKSLGIVSTGGDGQATEAGSSARPGDLSASMSRGTGAESEGGACSFAENKSMSVWTAENDWAIDLRITFKKRITNLFVTMSELKQFVQLNETGIKKIVKKYDKILKSNLKDRYLSDVVALQYPFQAPTRAKLDDAIAGLTNYYAKVVTSGDMDAASSQLKTYLREQVVWQRNTVWREMIGIERRAQGATLEQNIMGSRMIQDGEEVKPTRIWTPFGKVRLPHWLGISTVQLFVAFAMLTLLLKAPGLRFFSRIEEQNCLAMLVFCTILWATEVIPLFVTSLMVPLLVVTLRVARTDDIEDRRMTAPETTKWIFSQMFAPNMCLLLGGFTLAAALSKYSIDKLLAQKVLRLAGTRPATVLLAHMAVACFASMWISNVAAPVLMYSLIQPILRNLPSKSPFASALIMGIALASNIGGQTSPIASPQNLIALQYMDDEPLGWLQWFAITIPVSGLSLIIIWLLLLWSYGSGRGTVIKRVGESRDSFTGIQYFISAVALATIVLWCLERNFEHIVGDMGVIAILPMILFFGTGILTKEDFNNFLWTIVFLAMGGIALGKAVTSSGLLASLDELIQELVKGMPIWKVMCSLLAICLVVATFISHTIAAVLLVPIAAQVGDSLAEPHPRLLIMATVLTASAAMGLPVSGFPNMAASAQEDSTGKRYIRVSDFLRVGIPASILATIVAGMLGYAIMSLLGL